MGSEINGFTRRAFAKLCGKAAVGATLFLGGCASLFKLDPPELPSVTCDDTPLSDEYDYIVVGSGAGGGPLAANLARKGHKVLLLEAGGDEGGDIYDVPVFNTLASEDPRYRWDFFVRHYQEDEMSRKDSKFRRDKNGVLYPRAGTLGGCTAHNALILVYPHNSDWDYIADLTGDPSWHSDKMREYFERLENCRYVDAPGIFGLNLGRHGFRGWLTTSVAGKDVIWDVIKDGQLRSVIFKSVLQSLKNKFSLPRDLLKKRFDPNDWRNVKRSAEGLCLMPLTTNRGRRVGSREYIKRVESACSGNLRVQLHSLVTRVLLDDANTAVGVEYMRGKRLYKAERSSPVDSPEPEKIQVRVRREVILSGGAFNTPQLLMLSGIGPANELQRHGIDVRVDLPGVGENLQDRYEVGLVTEMKKDFSMLDDATFRGPLPGEEPDPLYRDWQKGKGIYTTNGIVVSFVKRSMATHVEPDLFIFGMPGLFTGYFPGYSKQVTEKQNYFTWAVLKAHTNNTAGVIRLNSIDPREVPHINFRYFHEGNDDSGEDLQSVVEGIEFVRGITARAGRYIKREVVPGEGIRSSEQLQDFVKSNAWGHHASCSCKMGPENDRMAVVDSRFRVHGASNLRVVDASVFPRIPGFFIVSAIYMISEKASDVILEDAL